VAKNTAPGAKRTSRARRRRTAAAAAAQPDRPVRANVPGIGTITFALQSRSADDPQLTSALFTACHKMLRVIAHGARRRAPSAHTLQTTMVVNEAFLKMLHRKRRGWAGSSHFIATVTRAMHNIVIDHLRRRTRAKRRGTQTNVSFDELAHAYERNGIDMLALRDSLASLARVYPEHAKIVELRFLGGFSIPEVGSMLGLHRRTVEKRWEFARAWLHAELA
jgi:RNA polymerase sigma factor (TIGR02999 family)